MNAAAGFLTSSTAMENVSHCRNQFSRSTTHRKDCILNSDIQAQAATVVQKYSTAQTDTIIQAGTTEKQILQYKRIP